MAPAAIVRASRSRTELANKTRPRPEGQDGNVITFGFKEGRPDLHWERIEAGAADLKRRFRLDFPRYARRMARDSKLRAVGSSVEATQASDHTLPSRSITRMRASPWGCATCSQPASAKKMSPASRRTVCCTPAAR